MTDVSAKPAGKVEIVEEESYPDFTRISLFTISIKLGQLYFCKKHDFIKKKVRS